MAEQEHYFEIGDRVRYDGEPGLIDGIAWDGPDPLYDVKLDRGPRVEMVEEADPLLSDPEEGQ